MNETISYSQISFLAYKVICYQIEKKSHSTELETSKRMSPQKGIHSNVLV